MREQQGGPEIQNDRYRSTECRNAGYESARPFQTERCARKLFARGRAGGRASSEPDSESARRLAHAGRTSHAAIQARCRPVKNALTGAKYQAAHCANCLSTAGDAEGTTQNGKWCCGPKAAGRASCLSATTDSKSFAAEETSQF